MDPNTMSVVLTQKEEFEDLFTKKLVSSTMQNIILKAIPCTSDEKSAIENPKFIKGFDGIISQVSNEFVDSFQTAGSEPSGSFYDSMVGCIKTNVSLEADYRYEKVINAINNGKIDTRNSNCFAKTQEFFDLVKGSEFTNKDIAKHFRQEFTSIVSVEEADVINDIKQEVADSVNETEAKNQLVQATAQEISDIKKEYEQPEQPDLGGEVVDGKQVDTSTDDAAASSDANDTASSGDEDSTGEGGTDENGETTTDTGNDEGSETNDEEGGETATDTGDTPDSKDAASTDENATGTPADKSEEDKLTSSKTAESATSKFIPIIGYKLKDLEIPTALEMGCEYFKAFGEVEKESKIRLDALKLNMSVENLTSNNEYLEKFNDLEEATEEAYAIANSITNSMTTLGLTQNGICKANDKIAIESANEIITRFITKKKIPSVLSNADMSSESFIAKAFDIVQTKQMLKNDVFGKSTSQIRDKVESLESAFYKGIINVDDPEVKDAAVAVMELQDVKFERIITPNFIKDYNMKVWESNLGNVKNTEEQVFNNVKDKFESTWGRPLTDDEKRIILATTNNLDATEIVPNPYEKLMIKFGREEMSSSQESGGAIRFDTTSAKKVSFKAKVYATVFTSMKHLGMVSREDETAFDTFASGLSR